jgi:hypothetical protein
MNIKNEEFDALMRLFYLCTADQSKISALHMAVLEEEGVTRQDIINGAADALKNAQNRRAEGNARYAAFVRERRKVDKNYAR